ncbi:MAG: glycosyltransferase family 1 protein [Acidimicrobiales bacterium]
MRIGLNLLYLIPDVVGGTQTYATSLLHALTEIDHDNEYVAFTNREARRLDLGSAINLRVVPCPVPATRRSVRYAYEQLVLPVQARRFDLDVLHSLGYVGPLLAPCPHLVTVHDLIYEGFKESMSAGRQRALRFFVRASARRADRVITVSASSRAAIIGAIDVDPSKVEVIYEAGRSLGGPPDVAAERTVLQTYGIRGPYVAAFGSPSPSKNLPRLVEAFAIAAVDADTVLVLIGHVAETDELRRAISRLGLTDRVVLTGYVPDGHVVPLLRGASLFAFPSLYEGFGLPVLDAQGLGVPVVCSASASLPEVAGPGALFFDPRSVESIAAALRRGLTDEGLRRRLVAAGTANVARFSWTKAARETLAVYEAAAGRDTP